MAYLECSAEFFWAVYDSNARETERKGENGVPRCFLILFLFQSDRDIFLCPDISDWPSVMRKTEPNVSQFLSLEIHR